MLRKSVVLCLAALSPLLADPPLNPQPPVYIVNEPAIGSSVAVCGNSSVFVAASQGEDAAVITTASNPWTTWNFADELGMNLLGPVSVCGYGTTFLAGWSYNDIGGIIGVAQVSVSTDGQGQTWGSPIDIAPTQDGNVQSFVKLCATGSGFMAVWSYYDSGNSSFQLWSSFSSDGTTWNPIVLVSNPSDDISWKTGAITGNSSGYVATWQLNSSPDFPAYANFSSDNGTSWSAPVIVAPSMSLNNNLSVYGTDAGFMAVWVDQSNNANWSFSTDGMTWSSPSVFASNLLSGVAINVTGSEAGFIAAWQDNTNNAWASFTGDLGQTWSTPVLVSTGMFNGTVNSSSDIGVSAVGTNCMFTWWNGDNTSVSSYSAITYTPPPPSSPTTPSSPFFKQVTPNNPGMGLW